MELYDIQVNHLRNPMGFRMERVCFSWKIKNATGKKLESARVVIASNSAMNGILFDTGYDRSADSLCFEVPIQLKPRTRYYYVIFARSDDGEEGSSEVSWFETGKRQEPWCASWVTCDSKQKRHPYFEKKITPKKKVANARLYICGLGLYEAFYNGNRIGGEYLTPYSNDYNQWLQYQTYDVTELLQEEGKLSVLLGNGWYKARFGFSAHEDKGFYGQEWVLIAELHIHYADGTEDIIGTDSTWKVRRSTITFSNLYDGEHRDDTLAELPEEQAITCQAPNGVLMERMSTPVTVHEVFQPKELIHTPKGELVLDMGQEFAGSFALKVNVPKGTCVHVQTGEILQNGCFYNENLRTAKSEYFYISNGNPVILQPHFTYYGYRYVKIAGISDLKKEDFTGLALYSDIPQRGAMHTGHDLINRLLSNVRWGLKSNFIDVPTDCPQRDERMGWTGDAQVFSQTATYLQDTYSFYAKYLFDMYQEQLALGGKVPDVIPSSGVESCACVWGDAACIIPWNLYCFYGDSSILKDQFESMKAWVDYVTRVDGNDHKWRDAFHYGDWLALDNMNGKAEQVLGATDEGFIANLYYAVSAEIVAKAAAVLGEKEAEEKYSILSKTEFQAVKREYFSPTGRCCIQTQTALLLALKYDLSENREQIKMQFKKLFRASEGKLMTGFVGTPLLCDVLSDNGMEDLAWQLLLNEEYPGWLHEIKLGATTVWERWNSVLDDGTISGTSMNSLNHYAYGSVVAWMFRRVAGMEIDEKNPGCRRIDFRPLLNWELRNQETVFDSPSGEYTSIWRITDPNHVELSVTVPFGCTASLVLPNSGDSNIYELSPGTHRFEYETDRDLRPGYTVDSTLREVRKDRQTWECLSNILDTDQVPLQYLDYTMREIAERFGDYIDSKKLARIGEILEKGQKKR